MGGKGVRAKGRSKLHDGTFFRTHRTPISLPFGNLNDDIPETRAALVSSPLFSSLHISSVLGSYLRLFSLVSSLLFSDLLLGVSYLVVSCRPVSFLVVSSRRRSSHLVSSRLCSSRLSASRLVFSVGFVSRCTLFPQKMPSTSETCVHESCSQPVRRSHPTQSN